MKTVKFFLSQSKLLLKYIIPDSWHTSNSKNKKSTERGVLGETIVSKEMQFNRTPKIYSVLNVTIIHAQVYRVNMKKKRSLR